MTGQSFGGQSALVTALPTTPQDGMEIFYLADDTNGVIWHLRYRGNSASTYKWEFVGGSPLSARVATDEATTSSTFAALTTAGPSITVPLAGDFTVTIGATAYNPTANAQNIMSYDIGATPAADADAIIMVSQSAGAVDVPKVKTLATAGTALVSKYRRSAGTADFFNRFMTVLPIRVG